MHAEAGRASTHPLCGAVGVAPRFPLHSCRTPYFCPGLDSVCAVPVESVSMPKKGHYEATKMKYRDRIRISGVFIWRSNHNLD